MNMLIRESINEFMYIMFLMNFLTLTIVTHNVFNSIPPKQLTASIIS